jgi:selenophosphate synthetase-related protein
MEVMCSSETSIHVRTTRRYIPENGNITTAEYLTSYTGYGLLMKAHPKEVKVTVAVAVQLLHRLHAAEGDALSATGQCLF